MATKNRWGRAIGAGVLVELAMMVVSFVVALIYAKSAKRSTGDMMVFVHGSIAWIECIGSPIVTFLLARWALRPLASAHMAHALVVAGVAVAVHVLTSGSGVSEGHAALWPFILADALKVAGGVAAAVLARRAVTSGATQS